MSFTGPKICKDVFPAAQTEENIRKARLVGVTSKLWQPGHEITVGFDSRIPASEVKLIQKTVEQWEQHANIDFVFGKPDPIVRVTRDPRGGAWAYLGTDQLSIPKDQPTVNFGWLDEAVILHEFGHVLGLGHEHKSPNIPWRWDSTKVIQDLSGPPNNWTLDQIRSNVLNTYENDQVNATHHDPKSIMQYAQPADWTFERIAIPFNRTLSKMDKQHAAILYPFDDTRPGPIDNDCVKLLSGLLCPAESDAPRGLLDNCDNLRTLIDLFSRLNDPECKAVIDRITRCVERAQKQVAREANA